MKCKIRSFSLLLLVHANFQQEVEFLHNGKLIKVNPSLLPEPFVVPGYKDLNAITNALMKEYRDPTVMQDALHVLSSYLLYIYPDSLAVEKNEVLVVFGYVAKKLLQIDTSDLEKVCKQKGLDYQKVDQLINNIQEDINDF